MTVIEIKPHTIAASSDEEGHDTYDVTWQVITNDPGDHAQTVKDAVLLVYPPGTPYAIDNDMDLEAVARRPHSAKRSAQSKGGLRTWFVGQKYTTKPLDRCQDERFENPLLEPAKVSGSFVSRMIAVTEDRHGDPLTNSASEPELPAPEIHDDTDTVIIEVNLPTAQFSLAQRGELRNKCNSVGMWGLPARTVLLMQWRWKPAYYGMCLKYIKCILEFGIDFEGWNHVRTDRGFRIKDGVDADGFTIWRTLMDGRDQPLRNPQLLDGNGGLLADGANPVELKSEHVHQRDLTAIPRLPTTLF